MVIRLYKEDETSTEIQAACTYIYTIVITYVIKTYENYCRLDDQANYVIALVLEHLSEINNNHNFIEEIYFC